MKHAYLIIAHNEWGLLQTLLDTLDDERNDIYIHIDLKVAQLPTLHTAHAGLTILEDRVGVYWADFSMIEAEYKLFHAAYEGGPYAYYHLISGVDLPLKSQDYIHKFFDDHAGQEFIGYTELELTPFTSRKVHLYHLFPHTFRKGHPMQRFARKSFRMLQRLVGYQRNRGVDFKKGSQWVSITNDMVAYILTHEEWVRKVFHHTYCCDEIVVQTLCWMSPLRENIYCTDDDAKGCMRLIGWVGDTLIDWEAKDLPRLKESPALWARKFNSKDMQFIQQVKQLSAI